MLSESVQSICWRCKAVKDPTWAFCPHCAARLQDQRKPSSPNPSRDILFLYDTYSFSWYNRQTSMVALYEAIATIEHFYDPRVQGPFHLEVEPSCAQSMLRAKIFAEYVAQLEAFGGLCLALAGRNKQSIMWTYLNAEPQDIAQLYDQLSAIGPQPLEKLLKMPPRSKVEKAIASGHMRGIPGLPEGVDSPKMDHVNYDYEEHSQNIVAVAEIYRKSENVRFYNKIKHVFPMLHGRDWLNPPLDPKYVAFALDDAGVFARLPMSEEETVKEISSAFSVMTMGLELMALYLSLYRLGVV